MIQLTIISHPQYFTGERSLLTELFEQGMSLFHLRKPESSIEELRTFIAAIPCQYHSRIVIHSHYSLASEFALKGIHCTSKGRESFYEWQHLPIQKSISTHGFCEAAAVDETFAYAFISPIFDSISKPGYSQAFMHDALQQFLTRPRKTKFIALGGITNHNIQICKQLGFDGVAVLGSLWNASDVVTQYNHLESCCL